MLKRKQETMCWTDTNPRNRILCKESVGIKIPLLTTASPFLSELRNGTIHENVRVRKKTNDHDIDLTASTTTPTANQNQKTRFLLKNRNRKTPFPFLDGIFISFLLLHRKSPIFLLRTGAKFKNDNTKRILLEIHLATLYRDRHDVSSEKK